MILELIVVFAVACLLSIALNWAARGVSWRIGLMDRPDGHRKLQARAIPLSGGIAIFSVMVASVGGLIVLDDSWRTLVSSYRYEALGLLAASGLLVLVGVLDDYVGLRGRQKLLGQLAACAIVVASGICIRRVSIMGWPFDLGPLSGPVTVFWLLGAINAMNLLDGIDGLVAMLGLILSAAIAAMAFQHHPAVSVLACVLAGGLVGFLRYNLPPATIYLGDAGSMFIGLAVGVMAIQASLKGPGTVFLASPLALWTIPIFDSVAAVIRRKLTGRSIYTTDRAHLHHCLVQRVGHRGALACLASAALFTSSAALISVWWSYDEVALLCAGVVVLSFVGLRVFGYSELLLLLLQLRAFLRSVFSRGKRKSREAWDDSVRLQGTRQWELLWETLTEWAEKLELVHVRLDVNVPKLGEGYHAAWSRPHDDTHDQYWRLELPLVADHRVMGYLKLVGEHGCAADRGLERLMDLLEQIEDHLLTIATAEVSAPLPGALGGGRDAAIGATPVVAGLKPTNGQVHS